MSFVPPRLPTPATIRQQYSEKHMLDYAEAYLKTYLASREPTAWAYRAFPQSELITLTMDADDLENATDGVIPLYE